MIYVYLAGRFVSIDSEEGRREWKRSIPPELKPDRALEEAYDRHCEKYGPPPRTGGFRRSEIDPDAHLGAGEEKKRGSGS